MPGRRLARTQLLTPSTQPEDPTAKQMPRLRAGGAGGTARLGSIKESDSTSAAATAADSFSAEKQALRRLLRPGVLDSAAGDPAAAAAASSPDGDACPTTDRAWKLPFRKLSVAA